MLESELEALTTISGYRVIKYLKEMLSLKKRIDDELEDENLPVKREEELKAAKYIVDQNIQKLRFEGIL